MDNSKDGNQVWAFNRGANGALSSPVAFPTGGAGTGAGLGNQGAVQLSRDGHWLVVVNPGTDDLSLFSVRHNGLRLAHKVSSGGRLPVSVTQHGNLIYVLNAGGATAGGEDSIAGFLMAGGRLYPLEGSYRTLSAANTGPAQIAFTRDGENLVVTEKGTGLIDTFQVGCDGLTEGARSFPSPVPTPFGFAVGRRDQIFVTQANGGGANPGGSSLSSYSILDDGELQLISDSVPTTQTAACWVTLSPDGRMAYTANTPNSSISSFSVTPGGSLALDKGQAAIASAPTDLDFSRDGRFLYSLNTGDGTIGAFVVRQSTGALIPIRGGAGLPLTSTGLAVR